VSTPPPCPTPKQALATLVAVVYKKANADIKNRNILEWPRYSYQGLPHQENGTDCGE